MSENGTTNEQDELVCNVEELQAYFSDKTPASKTPSDLPQWKQELLKKKEKEKIGKHKAEMAKLYEESQVPEWMRPLKKIHQRRKSEQSEKEEAERRKAEEENQRFEAMPAWKKQLVFKKRAKSADNLLSGCQDQKSSVMNSECKEEEKTENVPTVADNVEPDAEVDNGHENRISDNEERDEETIDDEVETSLVVEEKEDELEENGDIEAEDTKDDGEQTEDLERKDDGEEAAELGDNTDEVSDDIEHGDSHNDSEKPVDMSNEENHEEVETSDNEEGQLILCDEDESREEAEGTGEQQSTELEEVDSEDKNKE